MEPNHHRDFSVKLYLIPVDGNSSHNNFSLIMEGEKMTNDFQNLKIQGWHNEKFLVYSVFTQNTSVYIFRMKDPEYMHNCTSSRV